MTHRRPSFIALVLLLCLLPSAWADGALTQALDGILDAPALKGGITGAVVVRVSDGATLYAHNPDTRLLPASNRKLFTTAAALGILGSDFTFTTQVVADTKPDADGTLRGCLYLHGVGDSSLQTKDLEDLAAQVAKAGIRRVINGVYADGGAFTDGPYGQGWEWDDLGDEEFPQIAGLEANDGDITVRVVAGKTAADPVVVTKDPPVAWPPVVNFAQTAPALEIAPPRIARPYDQYQIFVTGNWPPGTVMEQKVPVAHPPHYAAQIFLQALAAEGVKVDGIVGSGAAPPRGYVLASHTSVPLGPYLALVNKPSDNLLAESLVRTLGRVKGAGGTYDAGDAVELPFFKRLGVDTDTIRLVDGCGLGRRNMVTARAVGQLLLGMHRQADWKVYYDSLPIAGVDGTLRSRLKGTRAAGNVHAKTGTLTGVRALSGYVTARDGSLYIFSLLMNNYPGTARAAGDVQDKFVLYLADTL